MPSMPASKANPLPASCPARERLRSILVATFDQVTDEMFGPGWNLYCQTLESNNLGMGKKIDGQKDEGKTI